MLNQVTLVGRTEMPGLFRYEIADEKRRNHTVEIPSTVLMIEPQNHTRGSDKEHLDTIACGAVLMNLDPESRFHKVDRSMVNRAYDAASHAQILGKFGNKIY